MDFRTEITINEAIIRLSEGCFSAEELEVLEGALDNNPEAIEYFVDCCGDLCRCKELLQRTITVPQSEPSSEEDSDVEIQDAYLWDALLNQEQMAPAIQDPREKSQEEFIQKDEHEKIVHKSNKRALFSFLTATAALVLFVLYIYLVPPKLSSYEVATLSDSINAKWANAGDSMKEGLRLSTGSNPLLLRAGFVELLFDNNAKVTIEGPAEFEIISEDRIKLRYGRLYSIVPQEALGFSVATPNAMIIDLGTQFGTVVDLQGGTELHVTQGKTTLVAGKNKSKISLEVSEGFAKKIFGLSHDISEISCNEKLFVRQISSKTNMIWRGQKAIDLADIVGGGNGLGSGRLEIGINPVTGNLVKNVEGDRLGIGQYVLVPESRYVDGVFVPNNQNSPIFVSSKGHVFAECPSTNNVFYMEIINSKGVNTVPFWEDAPPGKGIYGTSTYPNIFMHANLGITFDLGAIRTDYSGAKVVRFVADAGLSPAADREGNVDIWVLVDGKVRYCQKGITEKGKAYPVEVELKKSDRFLTLVTTDGGDIDHPEKGGVRSTDSDWGIFVQPRLELSVRNNE